MYVCERTATNADNQNKLTHRPTNAGQQIAQQQTRQLQQPSRQPTDNGTKRTTKASSDT